jgi:hypothetical protein
MGQLLMCSDIHRLRARLQILLIRPINLRWMCLNILLEQCVMMADNSVEVRIMSIDQSSSLPALMRPLRSGHKPT